MTIQKRKVKKPSGSCLIAALSLFIAVSAHAQTVEQDLVGLGMNPELADYISGVIPGGSVLDNATFLKGRNQADSADINILEIDSGDNTLINSSAGDELILRLDDDANRLIKFNGNAGDTALVMNWGDGGTTAAQQLFIGSGNADADDDSQLYITGGGLYNGSGTRGSGIRVTGNEAGATGAFYLVTGDVSGANGLIFLNHSTSKLQIAPVSTTPFATFDQTAGTTGGLKLAAQYGLHMAAYVPTMAATPAAGTNDFKIGMNAVPTAAAATGALLPASPTQGDIVEIMNTMGNEIQIFPGSGDTINNASANTVVGLGAYMRATCVANSASAWICYVPVAAAIATPGA